MDSERKKFFRKKIKLLSSSSQIHQNEEKNTIVKETEKPELQSQINSDPPIIIDLSINTNIGMRANEEPQIESQIPKNYFDNNNVITIEIEPIENEKEHVEDVSYYFH